MESPIVYGGSENCNSFRNTTTVIGLFTGDWKHKNVVIVEMIYVPTPTVNNYQLNRQNMTRFLMTKTGLIKLVNIENQIFLLS